MNRKPHPIDVQSFIDAERFAPLQWLVLLFGFLIVSADGYDTAAIGFIAPSLVQEWGVARGELGAVMSAALAGLGLGAILAGPVADRFGRKCVLVAAVTAFGICTLVAAQAQSIGALTALRFITGLGLGAAMPTTITMMSEYAPQRFRALSVNAMYCGFSCGLMAGGAASAWLIPHFGWRSVLMAGGVGPLALALVLLVFQPESAQFLAVRPGNERRIARILRRIAPGRDFTGSTFLSHTAHLATRGKTSGKAALALLLTHDYRRRTLLLWLTMFMSLLVYYFMTNWMPTLLHKAGFSLEHGALMASVFPLGGLIGNLIAGRLMDRFGASRTIVVDYLLSALLVAVMGASVDHPMLLGVALFLCGALVTSSATSMSTYASMIYPTEARTTGVAWMQGVGRVGGMAGSFVGAALLGLGWNFDTTFAMLALPSLAAAGALMLMKPQRAYAPVNAMEQ
ncbi:MFS transporter [Paraburkholderia flagellata]|uniref:MFS transporter n=1 Tax=Paraburkholderia flagellata TaxID=2883241 RepID=UPI001F395DBF|nr:aromatic acid/H+ symport family MFS transporter [Paraburkholderia flagellata]